MKSVSSSIFSEFLILLIKNPVLFKAKLKNCLENLPNQGFFRFIETKTIKDATGKIM